MYRSLFPEPRAALICSHVHGCSGPPGGSAPPFTPAPCGGAGHGGAPRAGRTGTRSLFGGRDPPLRQLTENWLKVVVPVLPAWAVENMPASRALFAPVSVAVPTVVQMAPSAE